MFVINSHCLGLKDISFYVFVSGTAMDLKKAKTMTNIRLCCKDIATFQVRGYISQGSFESVTAGFLLIFLLLRFFAVKYVSKGTTKTINF